MVKPKLTSFWGSIVGIICDCFLEHSQELSFLKNKLPVNSSSLIKQPLFLLNSANPMKKRSLTETPKTWEIWALISRIYFRADRSLIVIRLLMIRVSLILKEITWAPAVFPIMLRLAVRSQSSYPEEISKAYYQGFIKFKLIMYNS